MKDGKTHTTNYYNTFIEIAEDCPISSAKIPGTRGGKKTIAQFQYELLADSPYKYTSDDLLFCVFALRNGLDHSETEPARKVFFSKGQACLRASPLTKQYGFGIHADAGGKIALYGAGTAEYLHFLTSITVKKLKAIRNERKKS